MGHNPHTHILEINLTRIRKAFLTTRPDDDTMIKINQHPQGFVDRPGEAGFSTLVRTKSENADFRQELDRTLVELLKAVGVKELVAIEPYD